MAFVVFEIGLEIIIVPQRLIPQVGDLTQQILVVVRFVPVV